MWNYSISVKKGYNKLEGRKKSNFSVRENAPSVSVRINACLAECKVILVRNK